MKETVTRYNSADVEAMLQDYKRLIQENTKLKEENTQYKEEIQRLKWAATAHD